MNRYALGAILAALLLVASTGPAAAARKWLEIRSENFIIYSNASEKRALKLAEDLEYFRHYLQLFSSLESDTATLPLTVYAFRKVQDFASEMNVKNMAGFYLDRPSGALTFLGMDRARSAFSLTGRQVLFHEYVHYYLAQFSPLLYPTWFNEGIAEFYATFKRKGRSLSFGLPANFRAPALDRYDWLPMEKLLSANRGTRKEKVFYGQSWITVHYLMTHDERFQQINNHIKRLNLGMPYRQAFEDSFDISMTQLGIEVAAYWKKRKLLYLSIKLPSVDYNPSFAVRKLDKNEALLMLATAHLKRGIKYWDIDRAAEYVDIIRARDPANFAAIGVQIEVDMAKGALVRAMNLLRTLPEIERRKPAMLLLEGKLHLEGARIEKFEQADQWRLNQALPPLKAAMRLAPNSADALFSYGEAVLMSDGADPMLALRALLKARELLPQNKEIERAYAVAAMRAGYNQQAAEIFQDFLNWTSNNDVLRWARRNLAATGIDPETLHNSGTLAAQATQPAQ